MTWKSELTGRLLSLLTVFAIVVLALWLAPNHQLNSAQDRQQANNHPLIARGYTDATMGTVTIAGDARGGQKVIELRIKEGQKVKLGEIVAVLSGYPRSEIAVGMAELRLKQLKMQREAMLTGPRAAEIAMSDAGARQTNDQQRLAAL